MTVGNGYPIGTVSWGQLLTETAGRLEGNGSGASPTTEARWLIEETTGVQGQELSDILDDPATTVGVARLDSMLARRCAGEPIQYVLGHWAFRTLDLLVDQRVLIPRPETELVAGLVIEELGRLDGLDDLGEPHSVVDLGTGSGAIGLSVVAECPGTQMVLTDSSHDAIAVARANLAGLGVIGGSVDIAVGSWFDAIPERLIGRCSVIVSNPPYVPDTDRLDPSVIDWEPSSALRAGPDGTRDLSHIVAGAPQWLRPEGLLVLEFAPAQTEALVDLATTNNFDVTIHQDHAGHDRILVARLTR